MRKTGRQGGKIEGKVKHKPDKFWAISRSTETYIICPGLRVRYEVKWRGQSNKLLRLDPKCQHNLWQVMGWTDSSMFNQDFRLQTSCRCCNGWIIIFQLCWTCLVLSLWPFLLFNFSRWICETAGVGGGDLGGYLGKQQSRIHFLQNMEIPRALIFMWSKKAKLSNDYYQIWSKNPSCSSIPWQEVIKGPENLKIGSLKDCQRQNANSSYLFDCTIGRSIGCKFNFQVFKFWPTCSNLRARWGHLYLWSNEFMISLKLPYYCPFSST